HRERERYRHKTGCDADCGPTDPREMERSTEHESRHKRWNTATHHAPDNVMWQRHGIDNDDIEEFGSYERVCNDSAHTDRDRDPCRRRAQSRNGAEECDPASGYAIDWSQLREVVDHLLFGCSRLTD